MMRAAAWTLVLGLAVAASGCGEDVAPGAITADNAPAGGAIPEGALGHGTHDPKHGGTVLMSDVYHFEVKLDPAGKYNVYFTDMARNDLPASTAATVTIKVKRPGGEPLETIALKIDESGEGWVGEGKPVADPKNTMANIAYTGRSGEKPYAMDLEFWAGQAQPPAMLARPDDAAKPSEGTTKP
jgi:hypothetical protein